MTKSIINTPSSKSDKGRASQKKSKKIQSAENSKLIKKNPSASFEREIAPVDKNATPTLPQINAEEMTTNTDNDRHSASKDVAAIVPLDNVHDARNLIGSTDKDVLRKSPTHQKVCPESV